VFPQVASIFVNVCMINVKKLLKNARKQLGRPISAQVRVVFRIFCALRRKRDGLFVNIGGLTGLVVHHRVECMERH